MKPLLVLAAYIPIMLLGVGISNGDPVSAGTNWSSSTGFQSSYTKAVKDARADMLAKADGGYYSGFETTYTTISSTAIGAQVNFYGDNIETGNVEADNCGHTNSDTQVDGSGTDVDITKGTITCKKAGGSQ